MSVCAARRAAQTPWEQVPAGQDAIERAIARADIDASVPVELIASIVPSVAFHRVALEHRGLDEAAAVALVDDVLLPASGVGSRRRGLGPH
ncbi:MAG: TetR/AcrR family transcriptional regulator C-terminal ligand-binding domain-containing protein [Actinoplanes sp.]